MPIEHAKTFREWVTGSEYLKLDVDHQPSEAQWAIANDMLGEKQRNNTRLLLTTKERGGRTYLLDLITSYLIHRWVSLPVSVPEYLALPPSILISGTYLAESRNSAHDAASRVFLSA